jgi:hypothetical protein
MLDVSPRLRYALTRGFLIGEEIAHVPQSRGTLTCGFSIVGGRPRRAGGLGGVEKSD